MVWATFPRRTNSNDNLALEVDVSNVFSDPVPYSWGKAGDQYSLLSFGNLIKINGGEMPDEGMRVKMSTCSRRCADDGTGSSYGL